MKLKASTGRKLKYGGTSLAITALIIAAIIILNVVFSLLVERFRWYIDLTPDLHFTISDECYDLIEVGDSEDPYDSPIEMLNKFRADNVAYNSENGLSEGDADFRDENVKVNILFCQEADKLQADETMNYVYQNAKELENKFSGYITVEDNVDSRTNPSRFSKYLASNTDTIAQDCVIIECGTEYRIRTLRSFFVFVSDEPYGYNGEKAFASSILAVTRAEVPLACYTIGHGETVNAVDSEGNYIYGMLQVLEEAGYKHMPIDLSTQNIPEECRILITFDPKNDFTAGNDGTGAVSELEKIDKFLDQRKSYMVFISPDTGELPQLEELLGDWGLAIRQPGEDVYRVRDAASSLLGDSEAVVATYAQNDLMVPLTEPLVANRSSAPMIVFEDAAAIYYSQGYSRVSQEAQDTDGDGTNDIPAFSFGYNQGFSNRRVLDAFTSSSTATAWANDREMAAATKDQPFRLMAISVGEHTEQELYTTIDDSNFVMLCGSVEFMNNKYITSNVYGNTDFMLSAINLCGNEPVPVGLDFKKFANYEIESVTNEDATQYTIVLTLVPVLISLCAGVFVIVRRKNR